MAYNPYGYNPYRRQRQGGQGGLYGQLGAQGGGGGYAGGGQSAAAASDSGRRPRPPLRRRRPVRPQRGRHAGLQPRLARPDRQRADQPDLRGRLADVRRRQLGSGRPEPLVQPRQRPVLRGRRRRRRPPDTVGRRRRTTPRGRQRRQRRRRRRQQAPPRPPRREPWDEAPAGGPRPAGPGGGGSQSADTIGTQGGLYWGGQLQPDWATLSAWLQQHGMDPGHVGAEPSRPGRRRSDTSGRVAGAAAGGTARRPARPSGSRGPAAA